MTGSRDSFGRRIGAAKFFVALFLILSSPSLTQSCNQIWTHRWRIIQESWIHEPSNDILAGWAVTLGLNQRENATTVIADWLENFPNALSWLSLPASGSFSGEPSGEFFAKTRTGGFITKCFQNLRRNSWSVDESLPLGGLLRWENLSHSVVRWIEFDANGEMKTVDETPVVSGWSLMLSVMPRWIPIVKLERYLGGNEPIASFSHLEGIIPISARSPFPPPLMSGK